MVKFSIICTTYNSERFIDRCIQSVLQQTYENWEMIIVDNFSSDETKKKVLGYNDKRIKFFQIHNEGVIAKSRNLALEFLTGDFVCILDSDDAWLSNKLEKCLEYCKPNAIIYHNLELSYDRQPNHKKEYTHARRLGENQIQDLFVHGNCITPSAVCFDRNLLSNETKFDEAQELVGVEDWDFWMQLFYYKPAIPLYIDLPLTIYNMGQTVSKSIKQIQSHRNFIKKWGGLFSSVDRRNAIIHYEKCAACCYLGNKYYSDAIRCFKIVVKNEGLSISNFKFITVLFIRYLWTQILQSASVRFW